MNMIQRTLLWMALFLLILMVVSPDGSGLPPKPYSEFIYMVTESNIELVEISGRDVKVKTIDGQMFSTYNPGDPHLIDDLLQYNVTVITKPPEQPSVIKEFFMSWGPIILFIGVWVWFMRRQQGMGGMKSMGDNKAKLLEGEEVKTTFADVAGCDEAKEEVVEMVDFLKDPSKYEKVGGKIPRGALLVGPPGTGKTLLARAIAGEAKVPFYSVSGSDFVEMFVGVGASRVRDMFKKAKENSPCIVFIDEIDAVGRQRGGGHGGGNDEREQTLNQLLVEMDGFEGNEGIIIIAATNRADVLDKALLRPGRFDREIHVALPDIKGREQILDVHIRDVPTEDDVELKYIARSTPGFSGAELANIINEAALMAARQDKSKVGMEELEKAKDKSIMGVERHTMLMSEDEKRMTAYHEAGHCIVGRLVPEHDPVYKVSIMPRGRALGVTMFLPEKDVHSASKQKLESQLSSLYGGRIAEELIYGDEKVTTGASNDIERATELATNMVTQWGLSKKMGPLDYSHSGPSNPFSFSGNDNSSSSNTVSEDISKQIDDEIRELIERNYNRALDILNENMAILHTMTNALMRYETIDKDQIDTLMAGNVV